MESPFSVLMSLRLFPISEFRGSALRSTGEDQTCGGGGGSSGAGALLGRVDVGQELREAGRRDKGSMSAVDGRRATRGRSEKDVGGERRGWFSRCVLCAGPWVQKQWVVAPALLELLVKTAPRSSFHQTKSKW